MGYKGSSCHVGSPNLIIVTIIAIVIELRKLLIMIDMKSK